MRQLRGNKDHVSGCKDTSTPCFAIQDPTASRHALDLHGANVDRSYIVRHELLFRCRELHGLVVDPEQIGCILSDIREPMQGHNIVVIETAPAAGPAPGAAIEGAEDHYRFGYAITPHQASTVYLEASTISFASIEEVMEAQTFQPVEGDAVTGVTRTVISNRSIELAGRVLGSKSPVHPNDHVNMDQVGIEFNHSLDRSANEPLAHTRDLHIGHDKDSKVAKKAPQDGATLHETVIALGYLPGEAFHRCVRPEDIFGPY
ncbi:unnamed protein product [Phytophthora fragariaefolia]|uniref:Unnamed protein product n=1 Tax=Phytophthora fragariaefolia TaxID=1490495 RepID=A0A9W6YPU3_9STRA|nr:unnamed protein product [Phytophthora fragariaefolia]